VNVETSDFIGNILRGEISPAVTSCYQVHTLNADAHTPICGAAMLL